MGKFHKKSSTNSESGENNMGKSEDILGLAKK
jgi:hypothetical protein